MGSAWRSFARSEKTRSNRMLPRSFSRGSCLFPRVLADTPRRFSQTLYAILDLGARLSINLFGGTGKYAPHLSRCGALKLSGVSPVLQI